MAVSLVSRKNSYSTTRRHWAVTCTTCITVSLRQRRRASSHPCHMTRTVTGGHSASCPLNVSTKTHTRTARDTAAALHTNTKWHMGQPEPLSLTCCISASPTSEPHTCTRTHTHKCQAKWHSPSISLLPFAAALSHPQERKWKLKGRRVINRKKNFHAACNMYGSIIYNHACPLCLYTLQMLRLLRVLCSVQRLVWTMLSKSLPTGIETCFKTALA